jgi:TetR/AcrR family transcriptional repressor of nem operon
MTIVSVVVKTGDAMKLSKEQAAQNRQRIVEVATTLFRERGIDGVGLADLMKAAGFTHGGFYNHFASKEALAAEACRTAFAESLDGLKDALAGKRGDAADASAAWKRYLEGYLSTRHRDDLPQCCPTSGLVVDAARHGDEVQAAYADGLGEVIETFAAVLEERAGGETEGDPRASRDAALRILSELVGAILLSRTLGSVKPGLSREILRASRQGLCE